MNAVDSAPGKGALLRAYLPLPLIEHWARDPFGPDIWYEEIEGTLLHCDMSGFTAMSERLARLGREGAELMAGVLNRFFDRMLGIAGSWGGLQMKFGGDAMLLLFDGGAHCQRAAACALEMQRAMPEFRRVEAGGERHRLLMRAGIHTGRVHTQSAGIEQGTLHYLLLGPDVQRAAAVEASGKTGALVASDASAQLLADASALTPFDGLWHVRSVDTPHHAAPRQNSRAAPAEVLCRYLMPPFARPLAEGREPHLAAEHRRVTVAFIELMGVNGLLDAGGVEAAAHQVERYMKVLLAELERHGGFLAGSDAAEHGDKLIALFGAPVSSEHDETNALRFALELQRRLADADLPLHHRVGISTGYVFAGEIGSRHRREYTVIGDSVNLAARLMTAAPSASVYVSAATAVRAAAAFALEPLPPLALKGKAAPVQAFRLSAERSSASAAPAAPGVLLARDGELETLLAAAETARAGAARWAYVSGEPGIGKSALLDETMRRLAGDGWLRLVSRSQAHRSRDVFAAWQSILRTLFDIDADDKASDALQKITEGVRTFAPAQVDYASLIAGLLSLPAEEGPLVRYLDARARRQRLTALLRDMFANRAATSPIVLAFDDAHLCDEPSLELLYDVVSELDAPLLAFITSRSASPPDALRALPFEVNIRLAELTREDARRLAVGVADLDSRHLEALLDRAQGNPLFVQELALIGPTDSAMPESVNDVIVSRLDRLPVEDRRVLRAAAIAGSVFMKAHLQALIDAGTDDREWAAMLTRLQSSGFTVPGQQAGQIAFRHPLTQEVIYEALPFVERRALHARLAAHIEATEGAIEPGLLLHHYDRAGDWSKTVVFATLSGDRAARTFANREAIQYYERALLALDATRNGSESDRSAVLERIGQSLETQGRHSAATQALTDALHHWRQRRGTRRRRLLTLDVPEKARESALCRRIAVSCERSSAYDEALKWLDRALDALPPRSGRVAAEVFGSKSVTLYRKGEYRDAIVWGRRSLAAARRIGEPAVIAYAENMLATSIQDEGSLREAVKHYSEAVRLYSEIGDVSGEAAANNNLGACLQDLGMLDEARRRYEIARDADERAGDFVDMAVAYNNIGEVQLMQGDLESAKTSFECVLEAHRAEEELTAVAGLSCVNLSRCATARGDLPEAERHLREGTRLLRSVGAKGLLIEAGMQLAEVRLARGELVAARRAADHALRDARTYGDRRMEARGHRIVGALHARAGKTEAARARLAESVSLAKRIGSGHDEARALIEFARLHIDTGAPARARSLLRRAMSIAERMGAAPELAAARRLLDVVAPASV